MDESVQSPEINTFALSIVRDRLLPDLLQEDESNILYWAGKGLAEREELTSITSIEVYFNKAGFGMLRAMNHKGTELKWVLSGDVVLARMAEREKPCFYLEAGFLAQALESISGIGTETQVTIDQDIIFTVITEEAVDLPV